MDSYGSTIQFISHLDMAMGNHQALESVAPMASASGGEGRRGEGLENSYHLQGPSARSHGGPEVHRVLFSWGRAN